MYILTSDWFGYLFMGGLLLFAALSLYGHIYTWFDHSHISDPEKLRPDAKITKVDRRVVGAKNDKKMQTIVQFDDGFAYETHDTDRENGFFTYKIGVSKETSDAIIQNAIAAHDKACGVNQKKADAPEPVKPVPTEPVKKHPPQKKEPPVNPPPVKTAPENAETSLQDEFMEVYLQTMHKPLGSDEEAWNWVINQILSFKRRGLERQLLLELEYNVLTNLTEAYTRNFDFFLKLAGDMTPIVITCERLLDENRAKEAKKIAQPYLQYLIRHPELYRAGQICVQDREEAMLCLLERINLDAPRAQDNYTMFFVLYCRILDSILVQTPEEIEKRNREKEAYLRLASSLSPCNATVWEGLARIYSTANERDYHNFIQKALKYSLREGSPYGLGAVYENLAVHYVEKDPQLARALCTVSKRYGGSPLAAEIVLNRRNIPVTGDPKQHLIKAGIQIGFSTMVTDLRNHKK